MCVLTEEGVAALLRMMPAEDHSGAIDDMTMRRTKLALRPRAVAVGLLLLVMTTKTGVASSGVPTIDEGIAGRFARLALDCVEREYPNKISHVLNSDADAKPPRELTPAFFGCFDWHSSVHGHWMLARLARLVPDADFEGDARRALARSLTPTNVEAEVAYLSTEGRTTFERPYGLAWLLSSPPSCGNGATPTQSSGSRPSSRWRGSRRSRSGTGFRI